MFFITINHPKILNDLSNGEGAYIDSLVSEINADKNTTLGISKIQEISKSNPDPVDFAKSTLKAFNCCVNYL